MDEKLRFALQVSVSENHRTGRPHMSASVQVWNDSEHVVTIDLCNLYDFTWTPTADLDTIENYAVTAARAVATHLADLQMTAVEAEALHSRESLWPARGHRA